MFAHHFPEGAPVFPGGSRGLADVALMGSQNVLDVGSLKVGDRLGFEGLEGFPLLERDRDGQLDISGLKNGSRGEHDASFDDVR